MLSERFPAPIDKSNKMSNGETKDGFAGVLAAMNMNIMEFGICAGFWVFMIILSSMISLEQILWATVNPRHPDAFVLDLGQERKVKLQAASEGERDAWVAAIEAAKLKHVPAWAGGENKGNNGSARASAPSSATATSARPFGTPLRESGVELVDARDPVAAATPGQIDVELLRTAGSKSQGCCVIS